MNETGGGIVYLVLAHTAPRQLRRLVRALRSPSSTVLVHLDAKADITEFSAARAEGAQFTTERVAVRWGDFTQVEAILVLLREAFDDPRRFERFVLISGVDHPLRTAAELDRFFARHPDTQFMNLTAMPDDAAGKPWSRLTTYQLRPRHGRVGHAVWIAAMAVVRRLHRRDPVRALGDVRPYGGSTWWAVTRQACETILEFPSHAPRAARFLRRVVCPDEVYFPTIIANSPHRERTSPSLTYTDWRSGGANPAAMSTAHLPTLLAVAEPDRSTPTKLFARKFDDADDELVERLEQLVQARGALA